MPQSLVYRSMPILPLFFYYESNYTQNIFFKGVNVLLYVAC
jgi:hypothetical protein